MKQLVILLILFLGLSTSLSAETFNLVTGNAYPPFTDEKLPNRGMITEIIEATFKEMGDTIAIEFRPWKRGYERTKRGLFLGTFPYIKNKERIRDFYFSKSLYTVINRIFVKKDSSIRFSKFEDLKGLVSCIPIGYAVPLKLEEMVDRGEIEKENPRDLDKCYMMIKRNRADFTAINELSGWITVKRLFKTKTDFKALDKAVQEVGQYFIISKQYPDGQKILKQFNQAFDRLEKKGVVNEITNRHIGQYLD